MNNKQWFETWFNSPYYHLLYNHRDYKEAEFFITNLVTYLAPKPEDTFLDLACGAGRHSKFINSLGYNVTGVDLSENSINDAQKNSNNNLHFFVQDMREPIKDKTFNFILNLFTSFGYFENVSDNLKVLNAIKSNLKPNGKVVIDFMNASKVKRQLIEKETIIKSEIEFKITREIKNKVIIKNIDFSDNSTHYHFQEKVQTLEFTDFEKLCNQTDFNIVKVFGSYALENFNENQSDRLILVLN